MNLKGVGVGLPLGHMVVALVVALMIVAIATHDFSQTGYFAKESREAPETSADVEKGVPELIEPSIQVQKGRNLEITDFTVMSTNVSECMNLTSANEIYTLNTSITGRQGSSSVCINVSANNVTLDCKGYNLTGETSPTAMGVYVIGYNNTTVRNCIFYNYSYGIYVSSSMYNNLTNNTMYHSSYGAYVASSRTNFTNNRVYNNSGNGAQITGSNNSIINNTLYDNEYGFYVNSGSGNNFTNNTVYNCLIHGIWLNSESNDNLTNNNLTNNSDFDFKSTGSSGITVINLTTNDTKSSFTYSGSISLKGSDSTYKPDPTGYTNLSHYLDITNDSANAWIYINISYKNSDIKSNVLNNTIKVWKNSSGQWWNGSYVGATNGINETLKIVYANITNFSSIYAPMGRLKDVCMNLTEEGATYTLFNNITGNQSGGGCVYIKNNSITLDCNGYTLTGNDGSIYSYGIFVAGYNDTLIKNCIVTNYSGGGIYINNSINTTVINNTVFHNFVTGIYSGYSSGNTFFNNTVHTHQFLVAGIYLFDTSRNNISDNIVYNNTIGIQLTETNNSNVSKNVGYTNYYYGIYLQMSNNTKIVNNSVYNNTVWDFSSDDVSFNNTAVNLTVNNTLVSFTYVGDIRIRSSTGAGISDPEGYKNIGHYLNLSNGTPAWLKINISYSDSDVFWLDESTVDLWRYSGGSWGQDGINNQSLNTANNYISANVTEFGIFAPLAFGPDKNWSTFKRDIERSGFSYSKVGNMPSVKWNYTLATASAYGSPIMYNNILYFCTVNGSNSKLYALNVTGGSLIKNVTLYGDCYSTPTFVEGIVYVAHDGRISAYNATNILEEKWHNETGGTTTASPLVYSNYVYVGKATSMYKFYSFSKTNGNLIAEYSLNNKATTAAYGDGKVIFASGNKAYALNYSDITDKEWDAQLDDTSYSSPAISNGVVFVGDDTGYLYALNISDGNQLWNYSTGEAIRSSPAVEDNVVYFVTNSSVFALNFTSTAVSQKWNDTDHINNSMNLEFFSSPAISEDKVIVASSDKGYIVLNKTDGNLLWSNSSANVIASPVLAGDTLYIISNGSVLVTAFRSEDIDPPNIDITSPLGGNTTGGSVWLNVTTNEPANCSSRVTGESAFTQMTTTGGFYHSRLMQISSSGNITVTVECKDFAVPQNMGSASRTWTVDASKPMMSNVLERNITISSAVLTWTTDESANYTVEYGTTTAYGSTASNSTKATNHRAVLNSLSEGTFYHFRINSTDAYGNKNTTGDKFFVTTQRLFFDLNPPGYNDSESSSSMNVSFYVVSNSSVSGGEIDISQSQDDPTGTFTAFDMDKFYNISASQSLANVLSYYDLKVNYTQPSFNESTIKIFFYNNTTGWSAVSSTVNETANYVTARLTHFSYFAVGGLLNNGDNCTTDSQCTDSNCVTKFNSTQKVCAPSGKCARDSGYDNNSYKFCSGNTSWKCASGDWDDTSCGTKGCNSTTYLCNSGSSSGDGGGGGGGGGEGGNYTPVNQTTSSKTTVAFSSATKTQTVSVSSSAVDIREVELLANTNLPSGSQLEISQYDDVPTGLTAAPSTAYKYFYFSATNLPYSLINQSKIKFRVSKAWITDSSIDENSIKLYRKSTDWDVLDTIKVNSDTNYVYYQSTTVAFSYFAIIGSVTANLVNQLPVEVPEEVEEITQPELPSQSYVPAEICGDDVCGSGESNTTCPADCKETVPAATTQGTNTFLIIGGIVGAAAAAFVVIFIFVIRPRLEEKGVLPTEMMPAFMPGAVPTMPMLKVESIMEMPPEKEHELEAYIRRNLARGFTPQQVRVTMMRVGWKEDEIRTAFDLVMTPPEKEEELIGYAIRMLRQGFAKEQVIQKLVQSGWKQKEARHVVGVAARKSA